MIDHSNESPTHYQTMTNLLSPTNSSNHNHDLHYPSASIYHHHNHSSEVIISPHRSSLMIHSSKQRHLNIEQTDSDCDLDSSSSSSITNSSKLKKRRANLPKDSVRDKKKLLKSTVVRLYETICFVEIFFSRFVY